MVSFDEELQDIMNKSALALMISIGHRTGLFDVMAKLPLSSSNDIAEKANLNERYVREWLGALVTSKIIDYDSKSSLYSISKDKSDLLTRDGSFNFATSMQFIPVMAQVEDKILDCFTNGGGVPYESFHRFHEVMAEESSQTVLSELIDGILPLVTGLIEKLKQNIKILDVGCGSGRAINLMAKTFPTSHFTGYDFSNEVIQNAKNESLKLSLTNTCFEKQDAANFNHEEQFDVITAFDAIHDQANPEKVLGNIKNSLKPDGVFLMQDIAGSSKLENNMNHPLAPFLYTISCLHCMTVSLALDGKGLGAMWGKELATQMLKDAGFSSVEVKQLPHDPMNYFYIAKP
jgi:2-polyprenyl-3-methyl-5-hydroxy-6-metoxy-1,4-benzoquinol methylase